jgi:CubicO group peptidase (beta-lactamase class C family)
MNFHTVTCALGIMALSACGTIAQAAASPSNQNADFDRLVDAVVAYYHLPGIAVGVIENGKVTYTREVGTLESGKSIDDDTLFKIASNTKAMTATLLARLVQEGKLRWDDPVTKYLPSFRMYDPWVTKNIQVGDLLVHHSGLPEGAGDLMLWPGPNHFTPGNVVAGLRYLKPAYSFRAGYAYDNTLYIVAGQVAAAAGGASYPQLLRREVFDPLGMSRCQIGTWNRDKVGNVAQPHARRNGKTVIVDADGPIIHPSTMDAAGGVRCSLHDMLVWAKNWLAPTPQQLEWLTPEQRRGEWATYTPLPIPKRLHAWNGTLFRGNGRGWRTSDVDGEMTVWHTGVLEGMHSGVTLLPFRKSGFVILIDDEAENARSVLDEVLLKHFTDPTNGRSVASYADELARDDEALRISHVPDTSSRQPATPAELEQQLGVWQDPWFGKVRVCAKRNTVRFVSLMSPTMTGQVMRVGTRYLVQWDRDYAEAWLHFPDEAGGKLEMAKVDPDADFSWDFEDLDFTREHACE